MTDNSLSLPRPRYMTELERDPNLRSRHTRTQYASAIGKFERWRDGRTLTVTLVEEYLSHLQKNGASPNTVKQGLATVRWLAKRAVKIAYEERPREEAESFEKDIRRLLEIRLKKTPKPLPAGRNLEDVEISALFAACNDGTLAGRRDAALIAVADGTAIRNEELRSLKVSDLKYTDDGGAELSIRHGKGDKPRVVDLFDKPLALLTRWIEIRGVDGDYIFTRIRRGEAVDSRAPLTYEGTRQILLKRFTASALAKSMTWHDFRRTAIGRLLDDDNDPSIIQTITGHESVNMLHRYDRRPEALRKEALRKIQKRTLSE